MTIPEIKNQLVKLKKLTRGVWLTTEYKELSHLIKLYSMGLDKFKNVSSSERINFIIEGLTDRPKCFCGKYNHPKAQDRDEGFYTKYCSRKCSALSLDKQYLTRQTKLEKYGDPNFNNRAKAEKTCLDLYGWTNPAYDPNRRRSTPNLIKYRATSFKKYGVSHWSQNAEMFEKKAAGKYKRKEYTLPSGKIIKVQGYESIILNELVKHFSEDDICFGSKCPNIWYYMNFKKHRYHPDIYIKSRNMIIEVKSLFTLEADGQKNEAKRQACLDAGYNFWFTIGV